MRILKYFIFLLLFLSFSTAYALDIYTVDPTVNDDVDKGYIIGSQWFNSTSGITYVCKSNTDGVAVWVASPLGPASSTDNAIVRFNGTTGKLVQDSVVTINDTTGIINIAGYPVLYKTSDYDSLIGTIVLGNAGSSFSHVTGLDGCYNTFAGMGAGYFNSTGHHNTALGADAFVHQTTGDYNTALGSDALWTATACSNNTAVGFEAGFAVTTGNENTLFGYGAGYNLTTGSYNIMIGNVDADSATTDGQLNIGDAIKGNLSTKVIDFPGSIRLLETGSSPQYYTTIQSGDLTGAGVTLTTPNIASGTIYASNNTDVAVADGGTGTSTGSITGTTALTFTAGGTNQNITLTPSGTGFINLPYLKIVSVDASLGGSGVYRPVLTLPISETGGFPNIQIAPNGSPSGKNKAELSIHYNDIVADTPAVKDEWIEFTAGSACYNTDDFLISGNANGTGVVRNVRFGMQDNSTNHYLVSAIYGGIADPWWGFNRKVGYDEILPTARLHLPAGTATVSTAPLKFTTGIALTTPEDGAIEYHNSHLYFTISNTRYQIDQQSGIVQTPWTSNINAAGYILSGNSTSGGTLTLQSTSNETKGKLLFGVSAYDEVNNRLGIGTTTPLTPIHVKTLAGQSNLRLETMSVNMAYAPQVLYYRSHSDSDAVATTQDGEIIGQFQFIGVNAAGTPAYATTAQIRVTQVGSAGSTRVPSKMEFYTGDAINANNVKMTINPDGHITFTNNSTPTIGTCGTDPSVSGTDLKGVITVGTGAVTSCALNFGVAYGTAPTCLCNAIKSTTPIACAVTASTTVMTVTTAATVDTGTITYMCFE